MDGDTATLESAPLSPRSVVRSGVGSIPSRFRGGSSSRSTRCSRSASASASRYGKTATSRWSAIHALSRRSESAVSVFGPIGRRLSERCSAAASVKRKVDPRMRPRRWLLPIRLCSVALPVTPEGHLVAPVSPAYIQTGLEAVAQAVAQIVCANFVDPPGVEARNSESREIPGPRPGGHAAWPTLERVERRSDFGVSSESSPLHTFSDRCAWSRPRPALRKIANEGSLLDRLADAQTPFWCEVGDTITALAGKMTATTVHCHPYPT